MLFKKKKPGDLGAKVETAGAIRSNPTERHEDKKGDARGKIAPNANGGKKMSLAKLKVLQKMSKRLASSKGKVY